jgi:hypothetical protein
MFQLDVDTWRSTGKVHGSVFFFFFFFKINKLNGEFGGGLVLALFGNPKP